ncbi:reverse transcriptase N-terminal domain-containing protein [Saccharopolyspora pogona]|uniref:reverse transcriptase N-terminal domain-containing protein n=1 Tax=Saccharopolyspora pogona TaxID=333966 RepID=UPI0037CA9A42
MGPGELAAVERDVRRLRQRIFAAERAGDSKKVASLQKLMLRHSTTMRLGMSYDLLPDFGSLMRFLPSG